MLKQIKNKTEQSIIGDKHYENPKNIKQLHFSIWV